MVRRLAIAVLLTLSACAPIKPWERGVLAHRCMKPDVRAEEQRARQHFFGARESSQGASGEVGGGCGCN